MLPWAESIAARRFSTSASVTLVAWAMLKAYRLTLTQTGFSAGLTAALAAPFFVRPYDPERPPEPPAGSHRSAGLPSQP
jgi:hypothetical protein